MKVKILVTGGTFDKEYNEINGKLYFNKTHVHEILALGRSDVAVEIKTLMMVDSLDMTDQDREVLVKNISSAKEKNIVITHGTDTMVETAKYINKRTIEKTVVITGALIPYKFGSSDGLFNLGAALAFAQVLKSGVYVAMNGKWFPCDGVEKNKETGKFVKLGAS